MLSNIRIVLINTFHPGNVGAIARAMKNMGLSNLYLVDPNDYPSDEATSRAAGAVDLLENATIVSTLEEAISDCSLVIGTSARHRTFQLPIMNARECAETVIPEAKQHDVAIVFGRETTGLLNEEIAQCHRQVYIDANDEYPVLNISQAVQIVAYEIWMANQDQSIHAKETAEYPRKKEMDLFHEHLEETLYGLNFIIKNHPGKVLEKLQRFFNRSRPEKQELGILRGVLAAVQREANLTPSTKNSDAKDGSE
ncbi:tRNA (cytosine(32)/uridine(32)-2'-O)-methyltransferase TrmJ [Marinomonas mediterranea]|jgi:RNA methyltransferase, TrmH family, group 1|uniref:tRNA (cytidine/uridine-2'-O-)-methyltransferase TrmJ n=1 Tax=Marinomonas mediterranea (strain ATCC 700492 / JCM 21426 / NBRC 103028 / MMB-1) TaxID=717774 RepID=F2JU33_MARM1|nr:tRNA (cytosine(32)/uridine(32)-2'-O)-methyltransferase TrmJ [Marinomonas mediterranea]ADZ91545.1 RNA methyltransferase, TrmH family, group 1 [Marinomonas mediterranea MMB-1]WCN09509.1 tRNA (cytosine(32)/uridine(32)-2'-O)-methyltransferase TrmJ [Marinomonas mediterranea]WCN13584.1 tRNA (cytosine(32)/uridine(32)-2'-O)-methyltransferase TrmJ [Marinomonas mediterranea]WCN17650.1 tRNA (cytosine(32)/uridine(32)-2'-O)-methyltransferase TrmJ [Marinomonas mediterranea MMB-1]